MPTAMCVRVDLMQFGGRLNAVIRVIFVTLAMLSILYLNYRQYRRMESTTNSTLHTACTLFEAVNECCNKTSCIPHVCQINYALQQVIYCE